MISIIYKLAKKLIGCPVLKHPRRLRHKHSPADTVDVTGFKAKLQWFADTFEGKATSDFLSESALSKRKSLAHYAYNLLCSIAVAWAVTNPIYLTRSFRALQVGDTPDIDILSPITADIEPSDMPRATRDEIVRKVAPVYDYDDTLFENWLRTWEAAFRKIRSEFYTNAHLRPRTTNFIDQVADRIVEMTGQTIPAADLKYLHSNRFSPSLENSFIKIGEYLMGRFIAPTDLFAIHYSTGIVIRQIRQDGSETLFYDVSRIWSLEQARDFLRHVPTLLRSQNVEHNPKIVAMLSRLIIPNLKYNPDLTQKRMNQFLSVSRPPLQQIQTGQVIVRKGERVSEYQADILKTIHKLNSRKAYFERFCLYTIVLFLFFSILFRLNVGRYGFWYLSLKESVLFLVLTLFFILFVKYSLPFLRSYLSPHQIKYGYEYLLPIASGGIIIHLMLGKEAGYTFALLISIVMGFLVERNHIFALWAFTVTATAIHTIKACKQRTDLFKSGAWSGVVGAVLILGFSLLQSMGYRHIDWTSLSITVLLAFLSGLLSAVLSGGLIPILETLSGYTTSLKLLELSNFNHPLLHNLMMKAPGTYHHSVIVGSLAEIAADRVKANALLARVSAYYHDIGKMTKPLYFIENQSPGNNPHDHLNPSMSAKILFSHVKSGVRMALEHKLGRKITDIIEQHHGTTTVSYFLNKARNLENPEMDPVSEQDFKYPGPRPRSKEAAIVMLADACEAATRSIADPSPAKIQTMVQSIINRRFVEEQFNECDLNFHDLQIIEECFTRTLVSLYHHRIVYPGQKTA